MALDLTINSSCLSKSQKITRDMLFNNLRQERRWPSGFDIPERVLLSAICKLMWITQRYSGRYGKDNCKRQRNCFL